MKLKWNTISSRRFCMQSYWPYVPYQPDGKLANGNAIRLSAQGVNELVAYLPRALDVIAGAV